MKVTELGSRVDLKNGPLTVRDDGPTGKPKLELLGEQVSMSRTPVNDFRPEAGKTTFQMLGEKVPLGTGRAMPYDGATLSTRADKQQGTGK